MKSGISDLFWGGFGKWQIMGNKYSSLPEECRGGKARCDPEVDCPLVTKLM